MVHSHRVDWWWLGVMSIVITTQLGNNTKHSADSLLGQGEKYHAYQNQSLRSHGLIRVGLTIISGISCNSASSASSLRLRDAWVAALGTKSPRAGFLLYVRWHLFGTKLKYTTTTYYVGTLSRLDYLSSRSCHSISFRLL